ncbi:MAG: transglycosylase SLT domain-containing protein [Bacteroidota bacterium]
MRFGLFLTAFVLLFTAACESGPDYGDPIEHDLAEILERDTLVLLTTSNSTSYFLYRGEPLGFEYELVRAFANEHDVVLRTIAVTNRDSLFHYLNLGIGDVVAARLLPAAIDTPHIAFTNEIYATAPAVVQQEQDFDELEAPERVEDLLEEELDTLAAPSPEIPESLEVSARLLTDVSDLEGHMVHLARGVFADRLLEISDSLDGDIKVVEVEGEVTAEALIRQVAMGEIDLTVAQENLARLQEGLFENITVKPVIGRPHRVAWSVRKNSPELLQALNAWIDDARQGNLFENLYQRYFIDRRAYQLRISDEFLSSETGRLSVYDELLATYSERIGWDWRLLAALAFQESRFNPSARSWAGATGLLQLMPATAREFGVRNMLDPRQNVEGGTRFIQWLSNYWEPIIEDENERRKFILASYNTGHGHVEDARRLTDKFGGDSDVWTDVAVWLLQKSRREVYQDPVVRYGFCRGLEPVTYVSKILYRYEHYLQFVTEQPVIEEEPVYQPAA